MDEDNEQADRNGPVALCLTVRTDTLTWLLRAAGTPGPEVGRSINWLSTHAGLLSFALTLSATGVALLYPTTVKALEDGNAAIGQCLALLD